MNTSANYFEQQLELKKRMQRFLAEQRKPLQKSRGTNKRGKQAEVPEFALPATCLLIDDCLAEPPSAIKGITGQLSGNGDPRQFCLVIPKWGMSTNGMYIATGNKSKPRVKSPAYRAYIKFVNDLITQTYGANPPYFPANIPLEFRIIAQSKRKNRDIDNLCKPLQDILVKRGILADDKQVYRNVLEKFDGDFDEVRVYLQPLERKQTYSEAYPHV